MVKYTAMHAGFQKAISSNESISKLAAGSTIYLLAAAFAGLTVVKQEKNPIKNKIYRKN